MCFPFFPSGGGLSGWKSPVLCRLLLSSLVSSIRKSGGKRSPARVGGPAVRRGLLLVEEVDPGGGGGGVLGPPGPLVTVISTSISMG